ncbi:MAG: flippase-like domain-containing protein [Paraprevotella sp.]|nr:flippase-like domain-containing protein [Paraprevotella sp.]
METSKIIRNALKIAFPFVFGGVILWWMYRDFDWDGLWKALNGGMNWTWMWLSMPFGVLAQVLRAVRWKQSLEPLGEHPRLSSCVHAVFLSYASSLVVPRVGEVLRCGVLKKYDGVSFTKSLGTVVTERMVDSLLILLLSALTVLLQIKVFIVFFDKTGVSFETLTGRFTATGYWVTAVCLVVLLSFLVFMARRLAWFGHTRNLLGHIAAGVLPLRNIRHIPLYLAYSVGIWLCYFLHFYLTFYSFSYTTGLGITSALIAFVVGTFAVLIPTPNGAGPWHFAVKTILVLYGVSESDGVMFVLIVHTLQTLLVIVLGLYALVALAFVRKRWAKPAGE